MTCRGAEPPSTHARTVGKVRRAHWPSAQALCARLAAEGRSAALGAATAVVCWWRFDFAAFAAPLGLYCVASSSKSTAKAIVTGLATFAAGAGLLVLGDTLYFNSIDGSVVVAPVCKSSFAAPSC